MKKYLFSLIVGLFGFIGFSYGENVNSLLDTYTIDNVSLSSNWKTILTLDSSLNYKTICIRFIGNAVDIKYGFNPNADAQPGSYFYLWWDWVRDQKYTCSYSAGDSYLNASTSNSSFNGSVEYFILDSLLTTPLPMMTSAQCQSEYDLIPLSDVDQNYCVENDLCPNSPGSASWSELVINDVVHEGRPLINLNIPDYITRDYTVDENQYDIYVGSGYDQEYIDSILAINSYRPDSQDFTQIFVSGLTLIFPYIFVALLIVFIWKLLKRIFK